MGLLSPTKSIGIFNHIEGSHETTRPTTTAGFGTSTTPGNNTYVTGGPIRRVRDLSPYVIRGA